MCGGFGAYSTAPEPKVFRLTHRTSRGQGTRLNRSCTALQNVLKLQDVSVGVACVGTVVS